jgi:hypothetical protein
MSEISRTVSLGRVLICKIFNTIADTLLFWDACAFLFYGLSKLSSFKVLLKQNLKVWLK